MFFDIGSDMFSLGLNRLQHTCSSFGCEVSGYGSDGMMRKSLLRLSVARSVHSKSYFRLLRRVTDSTFSNVSHTAAPTSPWAMLMFET